MINADPRFCNFDIDSFCDHLGNNNTLTHLDISKNIYVGEEGINVLSKLLKSNSSLKILKIDSSDFEVTELLENFCDSLKLNSSLNELFLFDFQEISNEIFGIFKNTLLVNHSIFKIYFDCEYNSYLDKIEYLTDCNRVWKPDLHHSLSTKSFHQIVFSFLCCVKKKEDNLNFKIGRFVIFEIIKRIDRKILFDCDFPKYELQIKNPFSIENEYEWIN